MKFMMEGCNVGGVKEMVIFICLGGVLYDGMNGVITYMGRNTKYIWVYENMRIGDVLKYPIRVVLKKVKVWYTMKFDRRLLIPFQDDRDIMSMMREMMVMHICCCDERTLCSPRQSCDQQQDVGVEQQQQLEYPPNVDVAVQ